MRPDTSYYPRTLPFRVWCECRHVSGQHAAQPPHCCACNGNRWVDGHGSICDCQAFKSPALEALKDFLRLRDEIAELEHDCDPPEFTRCDRCDEQQELERRFRQKRELWAEEWAMILRDQLAASGAR